MGSPAGEAGLHGTGRVPEQALPPVVFQWEGEPVFEAMLIVEDVASRAVCLSFGDKRIWVEKGQELVMKWEASLDE
jgi:hypothetical protein